jgi:hypothetical protein
VIELLSGSSIWTYSSATNNDTITISSGTSLIVVEGTFTNNGTIHVLCGGSVTGTITGNPVQYDCPPATNTPVPPTATNTFTPVPTNTPTPTITNTPLPGCVPSGGQPNKCTPTPKPTKKPKRYGIYNQTKAIRHLSGGFLYAVNSSSITFRNV